MAIFSCCKYEWLPCFHLLGSSLWIRRVATKDKAEADKILVVKVRSLKKIKKVQHASKNFRCFQNYDLDRIIYKLVSLYRINVFWFQRLQCANDGLFLMLGIYQCSQKTVVFDPLMWSFLCEIYMDSCVFWLQYISHPAISCHWT